MSDHTFTLYDNATGFDYNGQRINPGDSYGPVDACEMKRFLAAFRQANSNSGIDERTPDWLQTLEDECLLGMNVTILNGAKIGKGSIIGANALVKTDMNIPENSLVLGIPGKIVKQDEKFRDMARRNAETYIELSKGYLAGKYTAYNKDQL